MRYTAILIEMFRFAQHDNEMLGNFIYGVISITTQGSPTQHPGPRGRPGRTLRQAQDSALSKGAAPVNRTLRYAVPWRCAPRHRYSGCRTARLRATPRCNISAHRELPRRAPRAG